ncbi:MAG: hypothetical protein ACHQ51_10790 [Elusimicrobiota bacterium]
MNNKPRLAPLFVAVSVVLSVLPQAALAQFVARPVVAPAASVGAAAATAGVSAVSAISPLTTLAPTALMSAPLSAPSISPAASAPSAIAAAAAPVAAPALSAAVAASLPVNVQAASPAMSVRTPGAAATGVAAEAAAYAEEREAAPTAAAPAATASRKGLVGRLTDVILGRSSASALFDASATRGAKAGPVFGSMGLQEHKPLVLPNGTGTDEQPTIPSPDREATVKTEAYSLPGARDVGGIFETSRKVLSVDPTNVDAVVAAVRAMIDADPTRYGVHSADLRLIGARRFEGRGDQADAIFVHFRQLKDNLLVSGSNMSFTLKVIDGKATVVAQTGQVYPQIEVDTQATMTEDAIMGKIAERVGMPVSDVNGAFQFFEEKIVYSRGSWRHVKLYVAEGLPFMIAVDLSNGLVFAWDNRAGLQSEEQPVKKDKAPGASGSVVGKAVDHGPILPAAVIKDLPLAFLNLTIGGKTYTTDKDGKFSAAGLEIAPEGLTLTATLSGPYVNIQDTTGKTLTINVTLKPGDDNVTAVFNKDATLNDENALAQVAAFQKVNLAYNFLKVRNLTTERMDKNPITVRTNVDDECNAYYTPGSPSLNFFKSSANCVNSAYDTVADHEYGHYWDDMTGGIMNGGLSEGWGDMVSMFLLNNPIIGEHFLKVARPGPDGKPQDYIRHGDNTYQYNEYDEVHDQGQAWQGFGWKLRKALMKELGDAEGAAVAEALIFPTMFAKAASIPDAIAQVLVNAMKKDGTIQYEKLIRDTAKIHNITLPSNPGKGFVESLVARFTAPFNKLNLTASEIEGGHVSGRTPAKTGIQGLEAGASAPSVRATLKFTAGALLRGRVSNEIRRYMDETGLKYELKEYKSWLSTDYLLVIEGPQDKVQEHANNISHWLSSLERSN